MFAALRTFARRAARAVAPIRAHVFWDGAHYAHSAWSLRDALAWSACYPQPARVWITGAYTGKIVARRAAR